jgi:hypothetical protein
MLPPQVSLEELRQTIQQEIAQLSARPSDLPDGFLEAMFVWVNKWWIKNSSHCHDDYAPYAFVHNPADMAAPDPGAWNEIILFREAYSAKIGGKVFLTTSPMLTVYQCQKSHTDIESLGAVLTGLSYTNLPTLIADPAHQEVHYCPEGIIGKRVTLKMDGRRITSVTVENIDQALESFHRDQTEYPDGITSHCFDNRKARILRREAEAIIRNALFLEFKRAIFQTQYVAREEQLPVGRPDISIYDTPDLSRAACIFELKVLRSRGTTRQLRGKPKEYDEQTMYRHAHMGFSQARKYKDATNALLTYLVCFDGRDNDTPQTKIDNICQENDVIPRRYYMKTSTRDDLDDGAVTQA